MTFAVTGKGERTMTIEHMIQDLSSCLLTVANIIKRKDINLDNDEIWALQDISNDLEFIYNEVIERQKEDS